MIDDRHVATEFSRHLGGRYQDEGPWSGQEFRSILVAWLQAAKAQGKKVRVDFDGVSGMPTSFLEEAFGGLLRNEPQFSLADLQQHLEVCAPQSPRLWPFVKLANQYMADEDQRQRQRA